MLETIIGASSMEKTKKKIVYYIAYAIVVVIFLMHIGFCFGSINLESTQAIWSVPTTLPSGMRYSGSTYYATTPQEFLYAISRPSSITIELVDNIDFSGNIYPTITKTTSVTINGNGYTILGVDINSASRMGLISETSASVTINNVHMEVDIDYTSSTASRLGGFVGYASSTVTINNCTVNGDIDVTNSATHYVGGFVGYSSNTVSIKNSINYADINTVGATRVGGLVGYASATSTTLSVCANFGDIEGATRYVGGLMGYSAGTQNISKCFNSGNITGTTGSVGGLIGYTNSGFTISSCYSTGDVTVGNTNSIGGLVGNAGSRLTINNCYSSGSLTSTSSGSVNYSDDTNAKTIGKYTVFNELYDAYTHLDDAYDIPLSSSQSLFPESIPFNGGDQSGTGSGDVPTYYDPPDYTENRVNAEIVVKKISMATSISAPSLIGNGNASYTNSYYYLTDPDVSDISGNLCSVDVGIKMNNKITSLTTFTVNMNKKISVESSDKRIPERMILHSTGIREPYDFETSGISIFEKIPADYYQYYVKNFRLPIGESKNFSVEVTTDGNTFTVYHQYYADAAYSGNYFWIYGVKPTISGNILKITPMLAFDISNAVQTVGNITVYAGTYISTEDKNQSLSLDLLDLSNLQPTGIGTRVSTKSDLKNKSLGSNYSTNSNINNGYPFLKDFYWMYM